MRGIRRPELVELISSFEEALGLVVPMPIFCAFKKPLIDNKRTAIAVDFITEFFSSYPATERVYIQFEQVAEQFQQVAIKSDRPFLPSVKINIIQKDISLYLHGL